MNKAIRLTRLIGCAAVVAAAGATPAVAQSHTPDPNRWRPVVYSDLQLPGEGALPYASLWADQLKRNNEAYKAKGDQRWAPGNAPAAESHVVVRSPERVVVLSVLHTVTGCTMLHSDPPYATLKRCPMRLAVFQNGRSTVADAGQGCFIEYNAQADGRTPDLVRNAALAAYDVDARTIRAGVVFKAQAVDECRFRVPIPPPK